MHLVRLAPAMIGAAILLTAPVVAQTAATSTAASRTTATKVATTTRTTKTNVPMVRTAKSLDCSKQADAKNVHGKARKSFMSSCKKA